MADCSKTLDFLREHNRMCDGFVCKDCPMGRENRPQTSEEYCGDFVNNHTEDAIAIVQKWSDEHPVMTWEGKLRELLPHAPIAEIMYEYCPQQIFGDPAPFDIDCEGEGTEPCLACWRSEYKEE